MQRINRKKINIRMGTLLLTALLPLSVSAQAPNKFFGQNFPVGLAELPPGLFRSQLENLPAPAQARALRILQNFEFPAADVAYLRADPQGGVFYEDIIPESVELAQSATTAEPSAVALTEETVFKLHSKPGASRVVHVNAAGYQVSGTAWNASSGIATFYMNPYDKDNTPGSFSSEELADIADIWKRIAEDYAAFDIDVTTEAPPAYGPEVGHILISNRTDANGNDIYGIAGGVAYVNAWGDPNFTYYQPALVFSNHLGPNEASFIAEAASHELGHNLGLSHDGTIAHDTIAAQGYYEGHGSGYTDWAPIMGVGYNAHVTQWSKGEYAYANNTQDDLAVIAGKLTYRGDDHTDNNMASATALVRSSSPTVVSATNPASDPANNNTLNKGIINGRSDVDLFYMDVNAGTIDLSITPEWIDKFTPQSWRGSNLDIRATLYNEQSNVVAQSNPSNDTDARITANVVAGRYYLAIEGIGSGTPTDGYSDYASTGQYFINGTLPDDFTYTNPPVAPGDLSAVLNAEGNGIELNWTDPDSQPDTNEVAYRVFRKKDPGTWGQISELPANSSRYADNNLANGSYAYYLEVYNTAGSSQSDSTNALDIQAPVNTYVSSEVMYEGTIVSGSFIETQTVSGTEVLSEVNSGGKPSSRTSSLNHVWTLNNIAPGALVTLKVDAEAPANSEGDDFQFQYAIDGGDWQDLGTITNDTGRQTLSVNLPASATDLQLKVEDTDNTKGYGVPDELIIHQIMVSSAGDPAEQAPVITISEPGAGFSTLQGSPFNLTATASDFEDDDSSLVIQWISDKDGDLHTGASFTANTPEAPMSIGHHTITVSVTDSAENISTDSVDVTITDPNAPVIYLNDLQGSAEVSRNKWSVTVTATVIDTNGDSVEGATVNGVWSGAASGSASCTTDGIGTCDLIKGGLSTRNPSVTFTVSDIAHSSLETGANSVNAITISAP